MIRVQIEEIGGSHRVWEVVLHALPHEGDHFEIDGEGFTVRGVLHGVDTTERSHEIIVRVR